MKAMEFVYEPVMGIRRWNRKTLLLTTVTLFNDGNVYTSHSTMISSVKLKVLDMRARLS
jgi:hypothetical protein